MLIKRIFIISLVCCAFLSTSVCANSKGRIVFSAPIENNSARVICEDKLTRAFNQIGYKFEVSLMPAKRALLMSNNGTTNGEVARIGGLDKDYPNLIQVNESCYSHLVYFYVKSGKEFTVDGWGSIPADYLLGYRKGMKYIEFASEKYPFKLYSIDNLDQSLQMLMLMFDRIDLLVGSTSLFKALSKQADISGVVRLEPAVEKHMFYPYKHKKHSHLLPELTAKLAEVNSL
ncbi:MAG: hypothetical protein ABJH28_00015 [Paraglaciecola sp.]|uniref:hypothetical protein n=1 Tax=Paraglaciecola sp. TaxID=1920173 RepID=UPI0032636E0F